MDKWDEMSTAEKIGLGAVGLGCAAGYVAGKLLWEGGKLAARGVKSGCETISEDLRLREEIEDCNIFCAEAERQFNAELEHYKREFKMIGEEYLQIFNGVKQQLDTLAVLEKIYIEREISQEDFSASKCPMNLSENVGTQKVFVEGGATAVATGVTSGLFVGGSVAGLMATFGTAGTGAAISGLTGAAKISALLAALGGGTIASGGLGIVGGIVALSASVALPAIIVTAVFAHDQIKSAHKEAMQRKRDAERLKTESKTYFAKLEECVNRLREINFGFRRSAEFLQRLIKLSIISPELGYDEDYQKIFREAAQVTKTSALLKVFDADNNLNPNLDAQLSAAKNSFENCLEHYIEFRTKISPQVLELTERVENLKVHPIKDEEIRAAFDEAVNSAQTELDITAMKLNDYLADKYIPKFRELLERNVTIKIFYGIGEENSDENFWTRKTADKFRKIFGEYPNFHMRRTDTHAKIFLCDDKFFVLSSYNVLSKDGERYTFGEAGLRSNNIEMIAHHRKEYFNF